jgi:hypothetical protein
MKKALWCVVGVIFLLSISAFIVDIPASYANTEPWIETDKNTYNYGEAIRVRFYNAPGYSSDWICIVPLGAADTEAGNYKYIPEGAGQGELIFQSPRPGEYEARAYYNYSSFRYTVSARYRFKVGGDEYSYEDQYGAGSDNENEYVDVPIIYGEPTYYTPPIAVTFSYDYFTYEIFGGFVDIIFWKGGHRFRHYPWYEHRRRITSDYIHTDPCRRISGSEFFSHRERLRQNHNIFHPDSYYGIKQRPWFERRPQQMEQKPQWEHRSPQQVEPRPQLGQQSQQIQQKTIWGQRQPKQIRQRPQQTEQRSQWRQRTPQQVELRPQSTVQRPQWGQRQPQQVRQQPQLERRPSRQIENQKPSREKERDKGESENRHRN